MATTQRNTKAEIKKRLEREQRARLDKIADKLATVALGIETVDTTNVGIADAISELYDLGYTITQVADEVGVPSGRLQSARRQATEARSGNTEETDEDSSDGTSPASGDELVSHSVESGTSEDARESA